MNNVLLAIENELGASRKRLRLLEEKRDTYIDTNVSVPDKLYQDIFHLIGYIDGLNYTYSRIC